MPPINLVRQQGRGNCRRERETAIYGQHSQQLPILAICLDDPAWLVLLAALSRKEDRNY